MPLLKSLKLVTLFKSIFCDDSESEETIAAFEAYIANNTVVIFSFSHCPNCQKAERMVKEQLGVVPKMVDMYIRKNSVDVPSPIHAHIGHVIGSKEELPPLPQIWVNKKYVGSFEDLRKAINTDKLTKAMFKEISVHEPQAPDPAKAKVPTPQFTFDI
mmetsp:Transcript_35637/g.77789  ORF Transcript_35637/g.77789 Transcript_35637/m.77789 type:complete len:158 (-) Transcript_35637:169-642(-)|eukprot:CAMPEP_0118932408 /NCGR_PEP_ID=MMETSP1169-20130426/10146_1 /TAXON_ID=36882 /ORGANISM="Pyramimonas obovata, Strain CCMP722" /LENGTH=157 /DNA_ID=CAMNT_0006875059 /DNA_START=100 /DNA_END=573 /DNA_ORIENTATION=+